MVKRGIPPLVREALESVIAGLWFAGILLLLYLTLRSQLAVGTELQPDWDLVALRGGTVEMGDAGVLTADYENESSVAAASAQWKPAP